MSAEPHKRKPSRRIWRWLGIVALSVFVGIFLAIFVAIPTVTAFRWRLHISSALRSASAVRLEEYAFHKTLTTRALAPAEYQHVRDALPIGPDIGIPGIVYACFIPHHRIVITDASHHDTTFDICFTCAQVALSDGGLMPTPYLWRQSLRQLFTRHDIPIRQDYISELVPQSP